MPDADYTPIYEAEAAKKNLDPRLLKAIAMVESNQNPRAVSPAGASGLFQLMPATAKAFGVSDPFDPAQSAQGGVAALAENLTRYKDDLGLALGAFNGGPGAIDRNRIRPETAAYVTKVLDKFAGLGGTVPPGTTMPKATLPDKTKDPRNMDFAVTGVHADDYKAVLEYVENTPEVKGVRALEGEQFAANEVLKQKAKVYQAELDRLLGEMRKNAPLPDVPTLEKTPKEELAPIQNPLNALQQFLPMLALLGGAVNKRFSLAAMDAATGAMNAQKAGDYAKRDQAHELWLDNTKRAVENNATMVNEYNMALNRKKATEEEIKAEMTAIAAKWGDDVTISGLPTKNMEGLYKGVETIAKVIEPLGRIIAANAAQNAKIKPATTATGTMVNFVNGEWVVASGNREGLPWDKAIDGKILNLSGASRSVGAADRQGFVDQYQENHNGQAPPQSVVDQWETSHKAATSELTNIDKQLGSLEPYVGTSDFEAKRVLDRLADINPTQYRQWNTWVRNGRRDLMGDPAIVKFDEALYSLKQEYGRIMSGAVGSVAQTMQHNSAAVDEVISGNMSYEQITAVVPSMMQSIHQRLDLLQQEKEKVGNSVAQTTDRLAGSPSNPSAPPPAPPAAPQTDHPSGGWRKLRPDELATLTAQERVAEGPGGHKLVKWGGVWVDADTGQRLKR
jgi:polyhydroxyalkanoate synthesis regulator phasin